MSVLIFSLHYKIYIYNVDQFLNVPLEVRVKAALRRVTILLTLQYYSSDFGSVNTQDALKL